MYADQEQQDLMDQVQIQPDHIARYWRLWWRRFAPRLDPGRRRDLFEQIRHPERFRQPLGRVPGPTARLFRRKDLGYDHAIWVRWQHFGVPLWPSEAYLAVGDGEHRTPRALVPLPHLAKLYKESLMAGVKWSAIAMGVATLGVMLTGPIHVLNTTPAPLTVSLNGRTATVEPGDCDQLGRFVLGPHTLRVTHPGEVEERVVVEVWDQEKGGIYAPTRVRRGAARACR